MLYGLFVGIEKYAHGLPPVAYAHRDATQVRDALIASGAKPGNLQIFLQDATHATVDTWLQKIYAAAGPDDTVVFFYAGHGLLDNGKTYLSCVDTHVDNVPGTAISLVRDIETYVKGSRCPRSMMFLDACHSGVDVNPEVRSVIGHMSDAELHAFFESAEFRVGFAACRSDQKSHHSHQLQNGIWSHYLIKALRGEVPQAVERGILYSSALQDYLADVVPARVVAESGSFAHQNPQIIGRYSKTFPVADLSEILRQKEAAAKIDSNELRDVEFRGSIEGNITDLIGWRKGHVAPRDTASGKAFFATLCRQDLSATGEVLYQHIKKALGYKMDDISLENHSPHATIKTKDFTLEIIYAQVGSESHDITLTYILHSISQPDALRALNKILHEMFSTAVLTFKKAVDIKELIRQAENEKGLICKYPSNFDHLELKSPTSKTVATFYPTEVAFEFSKPMGPADLLDAFQADAKLLAGSPTIAGRLK